MGGYGWKIGTVWQVVVPFRVRGGGFCYFSVFSKSSFERTRRGWILERVDVDFWRAALARVVNPMGTVSVGKGRGGGQWLFIHRGFTRKILLQVWTWGNTDIGKKLKGFQGKKEEQTNVTMMDKLNDFFVPKQRRTDRRMLICPGRAPQPISASGYRVSYKKVHEEK